MSLKSITCVDDLFTLWKNERPDYLKFSNDGILSKDLWDSLNVKIAFILKESNDNFTEIRGRSHGPRGTSNHFWRNLSKWKYTTTECLQNNIPNYTQALIEKEIPLDGVAYINLKKNAESKPKSNDKDIKKYLSQDWEFLQKQIDLINPQVLFCCGTYKYIKDKIDHIHLGKGVYRQNNNRLIIDFYHPSAPSKSNEKAFKLLVHMLSDIKLNS